MGIIHTATPWEFTNYTKFDGSPIQTAQDVAEITAESALKSDIAELWGVSMPGPDGPVVCYTGNGPTSQANAAFIATACNSHDDLLEALKWALSTVNCEPCEWTCQEDSEGHEKAIAAIAKAEAAHA